MDIACPTEIKARGKIDIKVLREVAVVYTV